MLPCDTLSSATILQYGVYFIFYYHNHTPASMRKHTDPAKQVRAQAEVDRVSRRLRDEEGKLSAVLTRLRNAERRARMLETGAVAARQRAEAGSRQVRKAFLLRRG